MVKYKKLIAVLMISFIGMFSLAWAEVASDASLEKIKAELKIMLGGHEADSVVKSPFPGLYEVVIDQEVLYISEDTQFLFYGNLIDRKNQVDLTRQTKDKLAKKMDAKRKVVLAEQDASKSITYKAKDEKTILTIFTDIDCPYCSKIHNEVPALNEKGITVRYMMFPRAGVGSPSFKKAVSVWCADDQNATLTTAKKRKSIPVKTCDNPVEAQYNLGQKLGVRGTPALITETGELIPGYVPAAKLIPMLLADHGKAEKKK